MENKYNKEDLKDFNTLNEKFDELTDKHEELSLHEVENGIFSFIIKGGFLGVGGTILIETFIKMYFQEFIYVQFETLSSGSLAIKMRGFDLK
tara:strand:+ start:362 stop:637 length:276 start_codon:yes stop_codon:yes gene_type:complete